MNDVIAVIPADMVILRINTIDGVGIKIVRIGIINKRMLGPIAEHHYKTGNKPWQYKNHERCRPVYIT